ncbi:MAG: PIN domain-containing protein [Nitrospirae bacterium]|nr:PIN domain-containing protein [Nitrospirota bacterium]
MLNILTRTAMIAIFIIGGYLYGLKYGYLLHGIISGFLAGVLAVFIESRLRLLSIGSILGGLLGIVVGLVFAGLVLLPFRYSVSRESWIISFFILSALLGYGGLFVGLHKGKNLSIAGIMRLFKGQEADEDVKILDTSVIIDGRIADIVDVGFLENIFVIPQFILQELQYIADSPDPMRRTKGRRGLDILHRMQKMSNIQIKIAEEDFPKIKEVDAKLIALAKVMNAKIVTNDYNLNKVAQVQGIAILNINELASVLKPVVLPGETMNVFILKEGKEYNQGIAYLDDGTMVVVENSRRYIGKNTEVIVTSVLQTTAGRMIFAKMKEED